MRKLAVTILFIAANTRLYAQNATGPAIPGKVRLTDSVSCTSVKDQSQSPTCWVFGTNSLIESDLIKQYNIRLNLSEMFIARYAYIDKAKQFLSTKGKTYFEGGGQFHDVIRVINNYGIVPEGEYDGRPDKQLSHNHTKLDTAMKLFTVGLLSEGKTELDSIALHQMNDTLEDMHMLVDTALHKGWSVGWEGDVTEEGFHYYGGYASFADSAHFYDEERLIN